MSPVSEVYGVVGGYPRPGVTPHVGSSFDVSRGGVRGGGTCTGVDVGPSRASPVEASGLR